jgi:hypothetical protein
MFIPKRVLHLILSGGVTTLTLVPVSGLACATCGCTLSTDAAAGYSSESGWRLNLEYDFIDQTQLRTGTNAISAPAVGEINNVGGAQEVEHRTTNRYTTATIGYTSTADWNFRLIVPYIDRSHSTFGGSPNPLAQGDISGSTLKGLGDVRLVTSWQGLLPTHNLGLQLGVKLPTGDYGGGPTESGSVVGRSPTLFTSGPAQGVPVDTSLQPGTGSTDIILGAFYYQPVSQNFDAFANGQFQSAVAEKLDQAGADYRPGNTSTVTVGLRYEADPEIVPQVQINLIRKSKDQGYLADVTDTAGLVAYLSPGVTVHAVGNLYVYGFLQIPMWSNLSGYQLFPRWTATVGASYAF